MAELNMERTVMEAIDEAFKAPIDESGMTMQRLLQLYFLGRIEIKPEQTGQNERS